MTESIARNYKLSKNFTLWEFLESPVARELNLIGRQLQIPEVYILNLRRLCEHVLQPLRDQYGTITITSGYRCPELNTAVNGSKTSDHCMGKAADIKVRHMTLAYEWMKKLNFKQLIDEYALSWIHVSYDEFNNKKQILKLG